MVVVEDVVSYLHREVVHSTRTHGRSSLAAENDPLRQNFICRNVSVDLVVVSDDVQLLCKAVDGHGIILIHSACNRSGRVFLVAEVLQPSGNSDAFRFPLGRYLVADAPHHD